MPSVETRRLVSFRAMPRPLVFGNGSMLIQFDSTYTIRDLFYPYVGQWNHLAGYAIRAGLFVDGRLSWLDEVEWETSARYDGDTGEISRHHADLGIEIVEQVGIHPVSSWFQRDFLIRNLVDRDREVRLFFHQDLRLEETDIGDTCMVYPPINGIVHFKRSTYVCFGGRTDGGGMFEHATGVRDEHGSAHTWRDADDGHLRGNAIDQGSVDSIFSLRMDLPSNATAKASSWIGVGQSFDDCEVLVARYSGTQVNQLVAEADERLPTRKATGELSPRVHGLFEQSLRIVLSQTDRNGAILAANDSDILKTNRATYSFMWPRDGALVAMAMDLGDAEEFSQAYLDFCVPLLSDRQPFFLHKYAPDGTLGATWHPWILDGESEIPLQEDETSLTVLAACRHFERHGVKEENRHLIDNLIIRCANFLATFIEEKTGLPKPSYDLWEERRGIHAYTIVTTIAALKEAAALAKKLGISGNETWSNAAERLTEAMLTHMVDPETDRLYRCLDAKTLAPDRTVDSATLALALYDVLPLDHQVTRATIEAVEQKVRLHGGIGGVGRYEHDYYFRKSENHPGNPWIICTMWLAQLRIRQGRREEAIQWLEWAADRATTTNVLSEQYHPETGEAMSVSPLTWSHAEVVRTVYMLDPVTS